MMIKPSMRKTPEERLRFENEERRTSSSEASSSLKKELLSIVASSRKANTIETRAKKREILDKVLELEKEASAKLDLEGDIQGRWSLVYSTDDDENKAMFMLDDANDKVVKEILDSLYKFFFAFAAPLAGGFSSSETAKRKERGGALFKSIRNEQIVDLTNESVENFVDLEILGRETRVVVRGEIKPLDKNQRKVQVTFTDWSFDNLVTLPLSQTYRRVRKHLLRRNDENIERKSRRRVHHHTDKRRKGIRER